MAYADTDHLFSQPIRTYKSNDPYYYEVDNIPIRQLEENILWTKDQIDSLLAPVVGAEPQTGSPLFVGDDIDLEHVKQLRPKFVGGRNIVVQAGWFNARVNDAYNVTDSLAQITVAYTGGCSNLPQLTQSETTAFFDAIWESYTTKLVSESFISCVGESNEAAAYRANGLETMFTFYISKNFGSPIDTATVTSYGAPEYREDGTGVGKTWPAMWHADIYNLGSAVSRTDWSKLNQLHLKIVQHWRGAARTSVVDFRGDTIEIPPFDQYDYFYVEEGATGDSVVSLEDLATQRIDLLVVYTHPIDASATTLAEYAPGVSPYALPGGTPPTSPKTITTPRLGLIRGAGIGIKRTADDRIELLDKRMYSGEQKILANLNDHTDGGSNTGIKLKNGSIVHGSFPSPDDLANIAPNLTLALADNDLQLVGQTALPIAYVVVTKGSTNLAQEDIIDIRPFLRTTELAYNERAGIAAAEPPLSFANPAVGAAQLDAVAKCIEALIPAPVGATTPATAAINYVVQEYIMGGLAYGPESALLAMNRGSDGPLFQTLNGITPAGLANWSQIASVDQRKYIRGLYEGQEALQGALPISGWLADTLTSDGGKGPYLGIPPARVVPLLPEWQAQIRPDTTSPDADKWYGGGINTGSFICQSTTDKHIAEGGAYTALFTQGGDVPALQRAFFFLQKNLRIILPPDAVNFSVISNYVNSVPVTRIEPDPQLHYPTQNIPIREVGSNQIMISRTGAYIDSETSNQIIDVMVLIPYPVQDAEATSYGSTAWQHFGNTEMLCYRVLTVGGNASPQRNNLGYRFPPNTGVPSPGVPHSAAQHGYVASIGRRGKDASPYPMLGYCFYPTVGLTFAFHRNSGPQEMVPTAALTNIIEGTDGEAHQWTSNLYPPSYDYKVIDLS